MSKEHGQKILRKDNIPYLLSWVLLIFAYTLTIFFISRKITCFLDADMSSELLLAKILSGSNGIITTRWDYSSEIRILYIQIITSFLFRFIKSWHTVRVLSTAIHIAIMLFSYYCLCRSLKIERAFPLTASILALPISYEYITYYLMGMYYLPFITVMFFFLALFFDYCGRDGKRDKKKTAGEITAYVIAFLSGLGGYRMILLFFFPLFLILFFPVMRDLLKGGEDKGHLRRFRFGVIFFISVLCGLILYVFVLSKVFTVQQFDHFFFMPFDSSVLDFNINAFIDNLGYTTGPLMFSGIMKNIGFGAVICLAAFSLFNIPKKEEREESRILTYLFICSVCLFTLVQLFIVRDTVERYISPVVILLVPVCANNICKAEYKRKRIIAAASVVLVFLKLAGEVTFYRDYKDLDFTGPYREVALYLQENDIGYGYSTFWNGNIITELTDGEVEMYHWESPESMDVSDPSSLRDWLQEKSHLEAFPEGKIAVILGEEELPFTSLAHALEQKEPELVSDYLYVYVFESNDALVNSSAEYDLDYFYDGTYLVDGYDEDGVRYLYEQGYSYGPMIDLPGGSYRLTITGDGLDDISFMPTAGKGAYVSDAMEVSRDNNTAVYEFCFEYYSDDVEFVIINEGNGTVRLDSVALVKTA